MYHLLIDLFLALSLSNIKGKIYLKWHLKVKLDLH